MHRITLTAAFVFATSMALATTALAGRPHFVGTPVCSVVGERVCCSGKIAGLGPAPTTVQVSANFNCVNPAGMQPGGLASGQSAPITPRGGQITFTNVCTGGADCPPPMTPSFGGSATINVFQGNDLVFSATIPIQ
jgi:hypothetical protein